MKLTVLGSSSAIFNPKAEYRYPAAHLVEVDDIRILLDASIGVLPQITKLGLTVADIDVIAISHFHADHFTIQPLLQAYFLEGMLGPKKPTLHLMGPTGIEEHAKIGFDQSGFSYNSDFASNVDISFSEFKDGQPISLRSKVVLTPYKTNHYQLDAYAIRVEGEGKALAYSGDSTVSEGLKSAALSADIFLCEAFTYVGKPSDQGHLNPYDAAKIATDSGSKTLVLTHYSGNDSLEAIKEEAKKANFPGHIAVASDLDSYVA